MGVANVWVWTVRCTCGCWWLRLCALHYFTCGFYVVFGWKVESVWFVSLLLLSHFGHTNRAEYEKTNARTHLGPEHVSTTQWMCMRRFFLCELELRVLNTKYTLLWICIDKMKTENTSRKILLADLVSLFTTNGNENVYPKQLGMLLNASAVAVGCVAFVLSTTRLEYPILCVLSHRPYVPVVYALRECMRAWVFTNFVYIGTACVRWCWCTGFGQLLGAYDIPRKMVNCFRFLFLGPFRCTTMCISVSVVIAVQRPQQNALRSFSAISLSDA